MNRSQEKTYLNKHFKLPKLYRHCCWQHIKLIQIDLFVLFELMLIALANTPSSIVWLTTDYKNVFEIFAPRLFFQDSNPQSFDCIIKFNLSSPRPFPLAVTIKFTFFFRWKCTMEICSRNYNAWVVHNVNHNTRPWAAFLAKICVKKLSTSTWFKPALLE